MRPPFHNSFTVEHLSEGVSRFAGFFRHAASLNQSLALFGIILLAAVVRLHKLDLYPLNGDEYNSIAQARDVGLNWNGFLYHALMHFWVQFGQSDFWLRLPAALFGILTVPLFYQVGSLLLGRQLGMLAALLAALGPFSVYHSQEVRFYSFFVFASVCFMLTTITLVQVNQRRRWRWRALAIMSAFLLIGSHFFGLLAVVVQTAFAVVALKSRWPRWLQTVTVATGLGFLFLLPLLPLTQDLLLRVYTQIGNVTFVPEHLVSSLSIVNPIKAAMALYIFLFGYQVYPGALLIVAPGAIVVMCLLLVGAARLFSTRWAALPIIYALGLFAVYFPLEAAGGALAGGIAPRHAAFVWPAFILILATGILRFRPLLRYTFLLGIVVLNFFALLPRWNFGAWEYGKTLLDFRSAAQLAEEHATEHTALLVDGRAAEPVNRYVSSAIPRFNLWAYVTGSDPSDLLQAHDRLILLTNDYRADNRQQFNHVFSEIENSYSWIAGRVEYPLFEYVFASKPANSSGYTVSQQTGQIHQPLRLYGLEFQDLGLPLQVDVKGTDLEILGSFFLPDLSGETTQHIPLATSWYGSQLILLSNVVDSQAFGQGVMVGEIVVTTNDGATWTAPIRYGEDTEAWDRRCEQNASCQTILRWHKRIALVGQRTYPDAWRDFEAGIHATTINFPEPAEIRHISFHYLQDTGQLYVWGIAILP